MRKIVTKLAYEIADSCARSDIECECRQVKSDSSTRHWYDTESVDADGRAFTDQAVRYLELRGLLVRDPQQPALVTFKESA